jgi:acyl-CoA synthetase (NDP forming)
VTPTHPLHRFLAPQSIAIVGASPERTKIRGLLLDLLRMNGYPGQLYPVNPSYAEIAGLRCFPSVAAIAAPIDLALIVIPANAVLPALAECAAAGVANAVIITSGFAEQGGAQTGLQDEIAALARRSGMRVCGPNAEGFHNELAKVAATFSPAVEVKPGEELWHSTGRRIAVVAQSGGMGFGLYNRGRAMGLRFSFVVTTGNEADLTASDFFDYLAQDAETDVIMLFLEGVRDGEKFLAAAATAAERGKRVIAIKMGRSSAGERATQSHTASLAGWNTAYDAAFQKHGITAAMDPDEAIAMAAGFAASPLPRGDRIAVVTTSGGGGAWAADALANAGLSLPELSPGLQEAIRAFIPAYGSARNPVDITAQAVHGGGLIRTIELLTRSDEVDAIAVVMSLASERRMNIDVAAFKAVVDAQAKPLLVYSYTFPSMLGRKTLAAAGVPLHTQLSAMSSAARALVRRGRHFSPRRALPAMAAASDGVHAALAARPGPWCEYETKALLAQAGMTLPEERFVRDAAELDAAALSLGYPLALKIQSRDLPHKTEIGGVRLGIADAAALREAYAAMLSEVARRRPEARIEGVLLASMARRGIEMIIGVIRDAVFGPLIMVGAGGVMAELVKDVSYRLAPVDEVEAKAMIGELRAAPLLAGYRGAPAADVAALAALVARLSEFAAVHRDLVQEVEINPVLVHEAGEGCTIIDALLTATPQGAMR